MRCRGGTACCFTSATAGNQWVEAEIHWIDGRRAFAAASIATFSPNGGTRYKADANTPALYHFDTGYSDSSGHHLNLTPSGNVFLTASNSGWSCTPCGQVARFQALGDTLSVNIQSSRLLPSKHASPITFESYIYPRAYLAYGMDNYPVISLYQDWDISLQLEDGKWNMPAAPSLEAGQNTILSSWQWNGMVSLNAWHKLKITLNAQGQVTCWIDGILAATASAANMDYGRTIPWVFTLGNFDGDVGEVRISNIVR